MHDQVDIMKSLEDKPIYKIYSDQNKQYKNLYVDNDNQNESIINENKSISVDIDMNNSNNSKEISKEESSHNKNKYERQEKEDKNNENKIQSQSDEEMKSKEVGINTANEFASSKFVNPILSKMIDEMKIFLNELTNPQTSSERKKLLLMKLFIISPIPKKVGPLFFTVRRYKASFGKRRNPQYELCMSGSFHFVMNAKKRSWNKSPNYLFTIEHKKLTIKEPGYFGKLR